MPVVDLKTLNEAAERAIEALRIEEARRSSWMELTDDQRLKLLALCCVYCGTTSLSCYCAPGYDE